MSMLTSSKHGFTLIEILTVVAIIGIMVTVAVANFSGSSAKSRDAQRQADLQQIQIALETYKSRNGRYPEQCSVGGLASGNNFWSGQLGTDYECDNGTGEFIVGLAPEYISVLPADPRLNGDDSGYVYRTNTAGTVYKLLALRTVESETVTYFHEFSSCDINPNRNADSNPVTGGWCTNSALDLDGAGPHTANSRPPWCQETDVRFQTSYGTWDGVEPFFGAFANATSLAAISPNSNRVSAIRNTTSVICQ